MGLLYDLLQGQLDDIRFKDSDTTSDAEDNDAADVSSNTDNAGAIKTEIEMILSHH